MIGDSIYIASGVGVIPAGQEDLLDPVEIEFPSDYFPVITVVPYRPASGANYTDDNANINIHLFTRLEFDTSDNKWKFNVRRSVGENLVEDGGIETMSFMWKAVGVKNKTLSTTTATENA